MALVFNTYGLPPALPLHTLGGHLARPWAILFRYLRLPLLRHQTRLFVDLDPFLARDGRNQPAKRLEWQIVRRLEMNARLSHDELLPRSLESLLQLLQLTRTP